MMRMAAAAFSIATFTYRAPIRCGTTTAQHHHEIITSPYLFDFRSSEVWGGRVVRLS